MNGFLSSLWGTAVAVSLFVLGPAFQCLGAGGDEFWDEQFGAPGANGPVYCIAVRGCEVFFGGRFSEIGGLASTNLARWDRTNWTDIGGISGGTFPNVLALATTEKALFCGGVFLEAGGVGATNIAEWNGSNWSPLGAGISGIVRAMVIAEGKLIVGGSFSSAGGVSAANIARWDGVAWSPLGSGIVGEAVDSLATDGSTVFAGGRFHTAGGVPATNIARWNGVIWTNLGSGIGVANLSVVRALQFSRDGLFAAGSTFRTAGGTDATNIAHFDGTNWCSVGSGIEAAGGVYAFAVVGDDLYVGGFFAHASGTQVNHIAKWSGTSWLPLGEGLQDLFGSAAARALAVSGSELFVGGFFSSAGNKPATNIALYHIPHALKVAKTSSWAVVSWPATGSNFVLEATAQLPATNWTEVPSPPAVVAGELVVTNEVSDPGRFYRLRRR